MFRYTVQRVISGGQTGIDQLGLEVAKNLGIPTGGVAPKGYRTESGPNSFLCDLYGLTEHESPDYPPRTKANVQQSDGTVVFGLLTGGTKLTVSICEKEGKPCIVNPDAEQLRAWLTKHKIKTLNVAGNRLSGLPIEQWRETRKILYDVLSTHQRLAVLFGEKPPQWGLRGDPFLWADLTEIGKTLMLPASGEDLTTLLHTLIRNLIGEDLTPGAMIDVPRYRFGGMSSGYVSADFWLDTAIPLLQKQLTKQR